MSAPATQGGHNYQHTRPRDCSMKKYGNMVLWKSCNVDILRSLKSRGSILRRKVKNVAPASCSRGPILSQSIISFELCAKMAEEIYLEKCNFRKFSEIQKPRDLYLDLGSGQGHMSMHNTYSTTSVSNHVAVALSNTKIWHFEIRLLSTFREVWSHVIASWEGNSKPGFNNCRLSPTLSIIINH